MTKEPDNTGMNPLGRDVESMHEGFKNDRFKAVNMFDTISGKVLYHTILFKERGRGKKWARLGNNGGCLRYPSHKEANADARKLRGWASG